MFDFDFGQGKNVSTSVSMIRYFDRFVMVFNFSHQEIQDLQKLPDVARSTRVLELWTLKEAFLKATGRRLEGEGQQGTTQEATP